MMSCPECDGLVETAPTIGEQYCRECGLIVDDRCIDRGPDWRAFDSEEHSERARTGAPETVLLHDKGLSTVIGWQDKDAQGNSLSARKRQRMQRLRTWDERVRTKNGKDRKLRQALGELQRMASALELGQSTQESASQIYRDAVNEGIIKGRGFEPVVAASLYAACRLDHIPRTLSVFSEPARVGEDAIRSAYQQMRKTLEIPVEPQRPHTFVPQVADLLDIERETAMLAVRFLKRFQAEDRHVSRRPKGLAGAAIFAANFARGTPEQITEEDAADGADVSSVTVRKRHREILEVNGENPELSHPGNHKEQSSLNRYLEGNA